MEALAGRAPPELRPLDRRQIEPQSVDRGDLPGHGARYGRIISDVGQHQMWTAQYYNFTQPRTWITSSGLGSMGYGLPAAMGAQMAVPH